MQERSSVSAISVDWSVACLHYSIVAMCKLTCLNSIDEQQYPLHSYGDDQGIQSRSLSIQDKQQNEERGEALYSGQQCGQAQLSCSLSVTISCSIQILRRKSNLSHSLTCMHLNRSVSRQNWICGKEISNLNSTLHLLKVM